MMLVLSPDRDTLCKWKHSQETEDDWKSIEEKFLPQMKDLAEWNQSQNYEDHLLKRRSHFSLSVRNESIVTAILENHQLKMDINEKQIFIFLKSVNTSVQ